MRHLRSRSLPAMVVALLALVVCAASAIVPTSAHGVGTPQRLNVPHGPYLISVWTDPDPLRVDETHVVVAVLEPATQSPIVTGIAVTVTMQPAGDAAAPPLSVIAGTDDTNRLLYAAEFNDQLTPGRWQAGVSARPLGDAATGDPVTFDVDVMPVRGFNWLWIGGAGLALLVVAWALAAMRNQG